MTEPINDQIRDLLARAMAAPPEPHTWADVERIAAGPNGPSSAPRRTGVWLAAACVIAVVAGFVVLIGSDDTTRIRTNDDTIPTTSLREELTPPPNIPSPTTAPATTGAETTTSTTTPEDGPTWRGGLLDDIDAESFRPLSSVGAGDLIVPTAPAGWRLSQLSFGQVGNDPATREWTGSNTTTIEARPGGTTGPRIELSLSRPGSTQGACAQLGDGSQSGCETSGSPVEINGVAWQPFAQLEGIRADAGDVWIEVLVQDFDLQGPVLADPRIVTYLESLRVGSTDDYSEIVGEIGQACWDCGDPETFEEPEPLLIGDIDDTGMRPLSTLSSGDIVVPTAPPGWALAGFAPSSISIDQTPGGSSHQFVIIRDEKTLPVVVAPACGQDVGTCDVAALEFDVELPLVDTIEIAGNTWGHDPGTGDPTAVIGDYLVVVPFNNWWVGESSVPLLEDPDVLELIEGLRVTPLVDVPDTIELTDQNGIPVDRGTGVPAPKEAVASLAVRETTLLLNAAIVDDKVCVTIDRADTGETIWPTGCFERVDFEQNLTISLAGPGFHDLEVEGDLVLLAGYVDSPVAVDVRATYGEASVDGRSAGPNDVVDGVFVLMPVTEFDEVVNFEGGFGTNPIRLEIIDPAD
jgi:hypothetical protein